MDGMPTPFDADALLSAARDHAAHGRWDAVRATLTDRIRPESTRPEAALLLAEAELRLGDPRRAKGWLTHALLALGRAGDLAAQRRAVNLLGAAHFALGELDAAESAFVRAVELGRSDGDDLLVARATNNLGAIANIRGRREVARGLYQLAVPAYQRIGSALGLAESFHNMAITFRDVRQLDQADEYERRAIEFAREAANPRLEAMARSGRAEVCLLRGDARLAEAGAQRAAYEFASIPDPVGEAEALLLIGIARTHLGKRDEAEAALDRAVSLARQYGNALIEAESLRARAELLASQRTAAVRARADAEGAIAIYARLGAHKERDALQELLERLIPARE